MGIPLAVAAGLLLGGAGIASAHVSAHSPDQLVQGGDAEIVFRSPNEQDTASMTKLEVDFSTTSPIGDASVKPMPGWTYQLTKITLPTPVKMADDTITSAVKSIVWTAQPGYAIKPGEFQEFSIAVEGLPSNTTAMDMPAVQTYDNGVIVNWNEPTPANGQEPEHPLPHLTLAAADSSDSGTAANATVNMPGMTTTAAASSDSTARWLGGIGLLLGALALGFGLGAYARSRQTGGNGPGPDDGPDDVDDDDDLDDEMPPETEKPKQGASA
ncbi:MAG TPA: YcnI family protein [Pseudonocardiaceae bacterium]|nr:YcnI family protein [Pseudonocardiaceae bacterium]